ncbi:hypothetical protein OAM69_06655 [bacterium]|nr:hypothetical protein [bacterium]
MSAFLQQHTEILLALVLLVLFVSGITLRNFLYEKQVASNGEIIVVRKVKFRRPVWLRGKTRRARKSYNNAQRNLLSRIFTLQALIFGLSVFMLGLTALGTIFYNIINNISGVFISPLLIAYLIVGIICAPLGVLLISRRNKNNPFE